MPTNGTPPPATGSSPGKRASEKPVNRVQALIDNLLSERRQYVWHRARPPADVAQALRTPHGHQPSSVELRVFTDLNTTLVGRGWVFAGICSGPEVLTWTYPPSSAETVDIAANREHVTAIVALLDRSFPTNIIGDCEVEIYFAGTEVGTPHLTGLRGVTTQLAAIESHRSGQALPECLSPSGARCLNRYKDVR